MRHFYLRQGNVLRVCEFALFVPRKNIVLLFLKKKFFKDFQYLLETNGKNDF